MEYWSTLLNGIAQTSLLEWIGVLSGVIYVLLAAKKQNSCWFFAMLSTSIFIYICYISELYIESWLQVFYFIMAIYGWINWRKDESKNLPIQRWPIKYHLLNVVVSSFLSILLGYFMSEYTGQKSPYLDAFTTIFSLAATFMVAQRVLENWIYWIIIDVGLAFLYSSRELYLTGLHYVVFSIVAIFAWYSWFNYYKKQKTQ
ncbi:MAG: nicotinamide riboside transporter PnuC [Brumimicrobium sp.]